MTSTTTMTARTISSRSQCLRIASSDAIQWADTNADEARAALVQELDGEDPSAEALADALRPYDSGFGGLSERPSTAAGVPARWADLYDASLERAYRRAIRQWIAATLAQDATNA